MTHELNVAVLTSLSPQADLEKTIAFAEDVAQDVSRRMSEWSGVTWSFHLVEPGRLKDDDSRRPSDFFDEASLRMVEGPYDMVVVLTNVGLVARRQRFAPGLASAIGRVGVVSLRRLLTAPRGEPPRDLKQDVVRVNAVALTLHLIGHLLRLPPGGEGGIMQPYRFQPGLSAVPEPTSKERQLLVERSVEASEREHTGTDWLSTLLFHLKAAAGHLPLIVRTLWRNRAPLLPLYLPRLATAAVAPAFILVFTAEIWDVGLNMSDQVIWPFSSVTVLAAGWYLTIVQDLFFPRKERRIVTEHMAVVNVAVFLTILLASLGLFVMVGLLMLLIETYIFPSGLISTWPTLQDPVVTLADKVRLAAFISSVGVITGALAGGLDSRAVIRHLALFREEV